MNITTGIARNNSLIFSLFKNLPYKTEIIKIIRTERDVLSRNTPK
jgi:hypothetical protein